MNVIAIVGGAIVLIAALNDVFQSVVVPRAVGPAFRVSALVWRLAWRLWPKLAWRLYARDASRREDLLATFAPLMLIVLLALWAGMVIFGFGAIFFGLRAGLSPPQQSLGATTYFAGTSAMTVGFGDIVGHTAATRTVAILAGATGLVLFSTITAYLFALFGSFQVREAFVVVIGARAGHPPSGINLLAIAGHSDTAGDLDALMTSAQHWGAQLMESVLAYPTLAYFRSSHDEESWLGTLGTLLDAATLLMTTVDGVKHGQARIFYDLGRHAVRDLSHYFHIGAGAESVGIERFEFEHACNRLVSSGFQLRDRDEAWQRFARLRANYAPALNAMAHYFDIPPLQWVGDRSVPGMPHTKA